MIFNENGIILNDNKNYESFKKIYDSLSKEEKESYGYDVGIDDNTIYTKQIGDAYIILDDYTKKTNKWHPYKGLYISIAAAPSARGTGVTDKLISCAKNDNPNYDLIAIIRDDNTHSINLFTRNGFKLACKIKTLINSHTYKTFNYYIYKRSN